MNLWQRANRSVLRKPIKSILLLLAVCTISLLYLSAMAGRSANIATKDSTRQAIGAGFLLEMNAESRSRRYEEMNKKIDELYGKDQDGSYGGVTRKTLTVNGQKVYGGSTDRSFESMKMEDIEEVATVEGIEDYNVTTVPIPVKPDNFERIEDSQMDQTRDFNGVALIGNRKMELNSNVLTGNVSIKEGRMIEEEDENVCVISEQLAEKNKLKIGDTINFRPIKTEEPVTIAKIIGIYTVKEKMRPYMSGDTFRSENVIFTDLYFPEKAENDDSLFVNAYYKVADVDHYEQTKKQIKKAAINWEWYDLIDNNGNLVTMAVNFNDLEKISNTMMLLVSGAGFVILFLIFVFWIKNRKNEIGILMSLGISKGKIWMQMVTEALIISIAAVLISFAVAPIVSNAVASYLVGQQQEQAELEKQADAGKVFIDEYYQEANLSITKVETALTPLMLVSDAAEIVILILLSTSIAGIMIFQKKPKEILSTIS